GAKMNDQRAQVLQQIRAALQAAHLPDARASVPPRAMVEQGDRAEMLTRFQRELEPLGGSSYLTQNANETITLILNLLREAGGQEILAWDEADLPVSGLGQALR